MTAANDMRRAMNLMEDGTRFSPAAQYKGRIDHPAVTYSAEETKGEITKVIANLEAAPSGRYTKLGRNLLAIKRYSARVEELKEQVKQDSRELVADLFNAEDVVRTRVVETVSFTFKLTKDPEATKTYKYAKILEELETKLTPELVDVLRALEAKYETITQKAPALTTTDKRKSNESLKEGVEELVEGMWDNIKSFLSKFFGRIKAWGEKYDDEFEALQREFEELKARGDQTPNRA